MYEPTLTYHDPSNILTLENPPSITDVFFQNKQGIEMGMKAQTASEMGGVFCE